MENKKKEEYKVIIPEEAEEIVGQRRKKYGLGESRELSPKEVKEIDSAIGGLLERLNEYYNSCLSPELQNEWYWIEQEAKVGEDRELAKAVLEKFLKYIEREKGK